MVIVILVVNCRMHQGLSDVSRQLACGFSRGNVLHFDWRHLIYCFEFEVSTT